MIKQHPSPNFNDRPAGIAIDTLVLHYTGMPTAQDALSRMCDAKAEVSAHYMIDEDGSTLQLVDESKRAWHAGISFWRGKHGLNDNSIGIEIVNPGHEFGYRPFPEVQMQAVITLCKAIIKRHNIPAHNVIAHSDIAPNRKEDPGEFFDWHRLAREGIGIYPEHLEFHNNNNILLQKGDNNEQVGVLQQRLAAYGYEIHINNEYDEHTAKVVMAFKRHFCPETLNDSWDAFAEQRLLWLMEYSLA